MPPPYGLALDPPWSPGSQLALTVAQSQVVAVVLACKVGHVAVLGPLCCGVRSRSLFLLHTTFHHVF